MHFDLEMLKRNIKDPLVCYGGGGKSPSVQTVAATPAPAPPADEAKMREFINPELEKSKLKAKTQGASSLQVPLGTIGGSSIGTL